MPEIERQGARIAYEVAGEGPAVLLGHGLLADRHMWRETADALARSHRVITIDVRGHGESSAPAPFSLWDLADDWRAIMDRERIDRAVLGGLSMGGMTAMRAALAAPDRAAALVLVDSNAGPESWRKRIGYELMLVAYRFGVTDPIWPRVARILLGRTTRAENPALVDRLVDVIRGHDPAQIPHAVRAVFSRESIEDRLFELRSPALVLVGDEDTATPPPVSERIRAGIPDARLYQIAGAGHMSARERPGDVADRLVRFLGEIGWTRRSGGASRAPE